MFFSSALADYRSSGPRLHPEVAAAGLHDVIVSGPGILDGRGDAWWPAAQAARDPITGRQFTGTTPRPSLVAFSQCQRVRIEGLTLRHSPMYALSVGNSQDVAVEGLTVLNPPDSPNTNGVDVKSAERVRIAHCQIDTGGECVALGSFAGEREQEVLVTDCTFRHGHGCSIGSGTAGGVRDITVRRCTFVGTETGVRLKSARGLGGLTENVVYEDLTMTGVYRAISINSFYDGTTRDTARTGLIAPAPVTGDSQTPGWKNIRIRNLTAAGCTLDAGLILGLPEIPAEAIVLEHVTIDAPRGLQISYARDVTLDDVHIRTQDGAPFQISSRVTDLRGHGTPGIDPAGP